MPCKLTLFYNEGQQGFTETWYSNESDPKLLVLKLQAADYFQLVNWRASPTTLFGVRAVTTTLPRKSFSLPLAGKYNGSGSVPLSIKPDPASTDAVFRITSQNGHKRTLPLRGLLDDMVQRDISGNDIFTSLLKNGIDAYMGVIMARQLGLLYFKRPGEMVNPPLSVIQLQPNPANDNQTQIQTVNSPNLALPVPRMMTALGLVTNDLPGFPRNVQVVAVSAGPPHYVYVKYRWRAHTPTYTPPNMRLLEQEPVVDLVQDYSFVGYHERKTGRPFGVPRGRSRPLVRAQ